MGLALYVNSTTASLILNVAENLGYNAPSAATTVDAERIIDWLNKTLEVVARRKVWRDLEVEDSSQIVTLDEPYYSLPKDIEKLVNVRLIDDTCAVLAHGHDLVAGIGVSGATTFGDLAGTSAGTSARSIAKYRTGGASAKMIIREDATSSGAKEDLILNTLDRSGILASVAETSPDRVTFTTTNNHEMVVAEKITITGTTNYDGDYVVTAVPANTTFVVKSAYTAETLSSSYWYKSDTLLDLSSFNEAAVGYWVWTDTALNANDFTVVISEGTNGLQASVDDVTLASPALDANKWTYVEHLGVDLTNINLFRSLGIVQEDSLWSSGTITMYFNAIHAYKQAWGGRNWELKPSDRLQKDRMYANPRYLSGNAPVSYHYTGKQFTVFRKPDKNYPIWLRYTAKPTPFVSSLITAESPIEGHDDLLEAGATWMGFLKGRQWEAAGRWESVFQRMPAGAATQDDEKDGWKPSLAGFSRGRSNRGEGLELPNEAALTERGLVQNGFYSIPF